jgi:hypothetical protein
MTAGRVVDCRHWALVAAQGFVVVHDVESTVGRLPDENRTLGRFVSQQEGDLHV